MTEAQKERTTYAYQPFGAVWELIWNCRDHEVLLEGVAGSGKTRGLLEYVYLCCTQYPGIRVLFLRNVKASLAESVLDIWENRVLWPGHPVLHDSDVSKENRRSYTFPYAKVVDDGLLHPGGRGKTYEGESHVVLGGLDKGQVEKTFSAQYDLICVFEAFEIEIGAWVKLFRANRNWKMPWQQMIADTNPNRSDHWLNSRADEDMKLPDDPQLAKQVTIREGQKQMTRLVAKHKDNPAYWDRKAQLWIPEGVGYMQTLWSMPNGPDKDRLLHGKWVSAEGLVFEEWQHSKHVIHGKLKKEQGIHKLYVNNWDHPVVLTWFMAGVDWGYHPNPGTVQVWGMDQEDRRFLVAEIYRTKKQLDWWAEKIVQLHEEFDFRAVICDASEPANIDLLNQRMGQARGRDLQGIARKPSRDVTSRNSSWQAGVDQIRFGLRDEENYTRLYVLSNALREGRDDWLAEHHRAVCFAQEMGRYCYLKTEDGKPMKEKEDPTCDAHGIDAARYVWTFTWMRDLTPSSQKHHAPGSMADIMERDKKLKKRRRA